VPIAAPPDEAATPEVGRVGVAGRGVRLAITAAVLVMLALGSFWGDDWMFPFGPLRMYSTSSPPSGSVSYERLEALTADGAWHRTALSPTNIGMNRAEVEGRTPSIAADPSLLRHLALAHKRLHPSSDWTGVRLWKVRVHLRNGVPQNSTEDLVATWTSS
jgi:hypothetical protein